MITKTKSSNIVKFFGLNKNTKPSDIKKLTLIRMAKNKEKRPSQKTKLGKALCNYTKKSSEVYDSIFTKKISSLRPDWFVNQSEKANQNKQILIKIAKDGKDKPDRKTKLGSVLRNYSGKSSSSYDKSFDKIIRKLRPDWFETFSDKVNQKKQLLISMAKRDKARPTQKTKIGKTLSNYTIKSSVTYDAIFTKLIRKLAPHWFVGRWW